MELIVNGSEVFIHTGGRPFDVDRPAVILIHGAGLDHTAWRYQSRYLAHHGVSVAAVDLPGHGRSGGAGLTTIAELADWTASLIGSLGVERAAVAGHSIGGLVALEAAARYKSVNGIVLIGTALTMPVHPEMLSSAAEGTTHVQALIRAWSHGIHAGGHPDPGRWMMGETWTLQTHVGLELLHADLSACNGYEGGAAAAAAIRCPVLVISSLRDRMVPLQEVQALVDSIPGARLEVLERAGHQQNIEYPWEVAKLIGDFVTASPGS